MEEYINEEPEYEDFADEFTRFDEGLEIFFADEFEDGEDDDEIRRIDDF